MAHPSVCRSLSGWSTVRLTATVILLITSWQPYGIPGVRSTGRSPASHPAARGNLAIMEALWPGRAQI